MEFDNTLPAAPAASFVKDPSQSCGSKAGKRARAQYEKTGVENGVPNVIAPFPPSRAKVFTGAEEIQRRLEQLRGPDGALHVGRVDTFWANWCSSISPLVKEPPMLLTQGLSQNPHATLVHSKSWLEVLDEHHRHGSNLHEWFKYWRAHVAPLPKEGSAGLGGAGGTGEACEGGFFAWLDGAGGRSCSGPTTVSRARLDAQSVIYLDERQREQYRLTLTGGIITTADGQRLATPPSGSGLEFIFVISVRGVWYGGIKERKRFQHTSFMSGAPVACAGKMRCGRAAGRVSSISPHSGHYRYASVFFLSVSPRSFPFFN